MGFMAPKIVEMFEEGMSKTGATSSKNKYKDYKDVEKASEEMKKGGKVSSASKRADGCCIRGKTKA
jgi:hypothetical protein